MSVDDMITISGGDMSSGRVACDSDNSGAMTDGTLYKSPEIGVTYTEIVDNKMKMDVVYAVAPVTGDTQGAVDFYLQVVD